MHTYTTIVKDWLIKAKIPVIEHAPLKRFQFWEFCSSGLVSFLMGINSFVCDCNKKLRKSLKVTISCDQSGQFGRVSRGQLGMREGDTCSRWNWEVNYRLRQSSTKVDHLTRFGSCAPAHWPATCSRGWIAPYLPRRIDDWVPETGEFSHSCRSTRRVLVGHVPRKLGIPAKLACVDWCILRLRPGTYQAWHRNHQRDYSPFLKKYLPKLLLLLQTLHQHSASVRSAWSFSG